MTHPGPFADILRDRPMPRLWCPPLTHFADDGSLDTVRMEAHWRAMRPNLAGYLVPGSTGEGWEMGAEETSRLLDFCLGLARQQGALVLVGMLRADAADARRAMADFMEKAKDRAGTDDPLHALADMGVGGFTVCASRGADLAPEAMRRGLEGILDLGLPTALYQLPQMTLNEIPAAMFLDLAARYPNLVLFKDSGGEDHVAKAATGKSGVYLVRGAEGDYASWLQESGGPYHGLLLGSANCFHEPLARMVSLLESGHADAAAKLSAQITDVVDQAFKTVATVTDANAFTNANKALDHFMAWGRAGVYHPAPMLHCGRRLPDDVMHQTGGILARADMLPDKGYLQG